MVIMSLLLQISSNHGFSSSELQQGERGDISEGPG